MTQNEFDFLKVKQLDIDDVKFISLLKDKDRWLTARKINQYYGWTHRYIRELAHQSCGRIISGQHGYRATSQATQEERHHAKAWLKSQARKMNNRADEIETEESRLK